METIAAATTTDRCIHHYKAEASSLYTAPSRIDEAGEEEEPTVARAFVLRAQAGQFVHGRAVTLENHAFHKEEMELQRKSVFNAMKLRFKAEHWQIQANAVLLRQRKQLREEGVSQDEIDKLLLLAA